jgi:diaminopimelate decarboxylase
VNHFEYGPEGLACEGVPLAKIADEVGTPVYVYPAPPWSGTSRCSATP